MKNLFGKKPEVSRAIEAQYTERLQSGNGQRRGDRSILLIRARLSELRKKQPNSSSISSALPSSLPLATAAAVELE